MAVDPLDLRKYDGIGFGIGHGPEGRSGAKEVRDLQLAHNDLFAKRSGDTWVFVKTVDDFPAEDGGIITLADETTYVITTEIDLLGSRLVAGIDTTIIGGSSEVSGLISTGLTGQALLTTTRTMPLRHIYITADIALDLDSNGVPDSALDWAGVNFVDCGVVGTIANYNNVIIKDGAFINSGALTFDGTIATVALEGCSLAMGSGEKGVILASSLVLSRRFRLTFSALVVPVTSTGIEVEDIALTLPLNETFILDTVAFSGAGTYLAGISAADNQALFRFCTGIDNSRDVVQYGMTANANDTALDQSTPIKAEGTTTAGVTSKFTHADNRATYTGALTELFEVVIIATVTGTNNDDVGVSSAKNDVYQTASEARSTLNAGGRAEGIVSHSIIELTDGDYVEAWVSNYSSGNDVIVENLNVIIKRVL